MAIKEGDKAALFTLPRDDGGKFSLAEALKDHVVVLFFYPKDFTSICTAEACAFRDSHEDFARAGALVVGVSSDDRSSHEDFKSQHGLPYTLLSDEGGKVRKTYGASSLLGALPGRVTYVIGRDGFVHFSFSSQTKGREHAKKALETVKRLLELDSQKG